MALLGSSIGVNAVDTAEFNYEHIPLFSFPSKFTTYTTGRFIKGASLKYPANSNIQKRLKDAAERGSKYWYLRSKQEYKYFYHNKEAKFPMLNCTKENLDSVAQQLGYMAADIAVSECSSRIAELEPVKNIIQSQPIQYVSDSISERNKKFFKDQAIYVASAGLVNEAYKLGEKGQSFMSIHNGLNYLPQKLYAFDKSRSQPSQFDKDVFRYSQATLYKGEIGFSGALTESVAINSLDHFVVSKYVSEEYSPLVTWGLCNYVVFPIVKAFLIKNNF